VSGFIPNQGLDNDEMPMEYNLFAAVCHKESRNKTSGVFTAQCKIKKLVMVIGSNRTMQVLS
jgi:hypothetical protein